MCINECLLTENIIFSLILFAFLVFYSSAPKFGTFCMSHGAKASAAISWVLTMASAANNSDVSATNFTRLFGARKLDLFD